MITVLEAIKLSTDFLQKKGIESARTNAEMLLAYVLNCKRLELYLQFDRPLKENELNIYRNVIKRRSNFEPLQYIIGSVEFYGMKFKVSRAVLIPRPETELLVETILAVLKKTEKYSILDIGCGSGCIGITLTVNLLSKKVICTDNSEKAIELAKENSQLHDVDSKINFVQHDIISQPINFVDDVDVVVSNPPYIAKSEFDLLQQEIKNFEPRQALTDDADGYTFFEAICSKSIRILKKGGMLFFEISEGQSSAVKKIMQEYSYSEINTIKDYQQIDRVIYGVKK
ncbi:MAG: peptide chain release factor N(5)-glutamine methyltransferase [Ignavibacteria bacterium]|nr:peptide chain release factor N(5)-glutamine methyltransferase [Ignavibacteria bacterium]MBT8382676.1 peptide chain release factor N(5)-glutamine methyltransferase [Ignavibacteria bacterium]MBT8391741.1 peptide chain release factor N(5)-glutamine methyltransferase [Ignavibacteria bacterium]NNJ51585.1 peptide chain release factor N(5)-glutamine methyltransferase [Ignavibacteriaceae bacterium]NNL20323.1 peptide chain release factor N(5)-glutamine methyltransferase [Ignavibacteriaceae bacterium]